MSPLKQSWRFLKIRNIIATVSSRGLEPGPVAALFGPDSRSCLERGRSSAGRASRSQCEGREFDPPRLHQKFEG